MEREEYYGHKNRNIVEMVFVIFSIFLKHSEKERKLMATNY